MDATPFGGELPRVQEALHSFPSVEVEQRLMRTWVLDAFVADDADVIGVAEHGEEPRPRYRLRRAARGRQRPQPPSGDLVKQLDDGVVAGGVLLEHPTDHRTAFWVDLHRAVLPPALVTSANVQISDRRSHRRAPGRDFLRQTLHHLCGEIFGVELRNRRHDPVQQHPGGGLIDVLRRRDERDSCIEQRPVDLDVVEAVACEPVDLVDDAIRHLVTGDVVEHPLQIWAIGGSGGFPGINEFGHDPRAERFRLPTIGFALCRDRESLVAAALGGLLLGRDPLVGHRSQGGGFLSL